LPGHARQEFFALHIADGRDFLNDDCGAEPQVEQGAQHFAPVGMFLEYEERKT
jgi:hypothetical protein